MRKAGQRNAHLLQHTICHVRGIYRTSHTDMKVGVEVGKDERTSYAEDGLTRAPSTSRNPLTAHGLFGSHLSGAGAQSQSMIFIATASSNWAFSL
jgi:hypothetical protein